MTGEEDSSGTGVQVSPPSATGSHDHYDHYDVGGDWAHLSYPDELKPSDSASRPRTSNRHQNSNAARSGPSRRHSTRHHLPPEREPVAHRSRRHRHPPASPSPVESEDFGDDFEEYPPPRGPPERPYWAPHAPAPPPGYVRSSVSAPSYNPYPQYGNVPYGPMQPAHAGHPGISSNQLVQSGHMAQMGHMGHMGSVNGNMGHYPLGQPQNYPYGPSLFPPHPQAHNHPIPPPFFNGQENHTHQQQIPHPRNRHVHHHRRTRSQSHPPPPLRDESESPPPRPHYAHTVHPGHPIPQFPHSPFGPAEMVPYAGGPHGGLHVGPHVIGGPHGGPGYFSPYGHHFPLPPGMIAPHFFHQFQRPRSLSPPPPAKEPSSPPTAPTVPPPPPQPDSKDEAIARLEKLILDERMERETKEAAREAAIEKAARDKAAAEERAAIEKKIAEEAADKASKIARAEAMKEAEAKAAEEAAKAKIAAEEAAALAAAEAAEKATIEANAKTAEAVAAATAAALAPPAEKKKPIKFKDAVGRKFSFPFHLCNTWPGMEDLVRQAFLHVDRIGPHVAEGHYDLVGPNGDIILPQVWETVVEPDWTITMHMWPLPEEPKTPDPSMVLEDDRNLVTIVDLKRAEAAGAPPPLYPPVPPPPPDAAAFMASGLPPHLIPDPFVDLHHPIPADAQPSPPPHGPKRPRPRDLPAGAFAMWMTGNRGKLKPGFKNGKKA
ncbi:uncharacterized protein PADG_03993 [Paracoccidioides brasiliensis Pb18]|uniref:Ubiquitin-like domain-containing protein n=2 Tax=Paracoccidioides brasiliensis TaxID=121759 RepID=C1G9Q7_PARBD|nr:uncharacterized protein PADG_03993 [Paracoccidioides brasiliensis Pb18]EEH47909.2 hypothetical protein PADG_03993 [Paracoccidioides brasiliensis Pb18]ODH33880.1 hypothetical protein ACO22_03243 [Paracoccidioides brasiliensis]ODH47193.1 hypothetical protein GX48_06708 [Paracoccidioides brasiliensis]